MEWERVSCLAALPSATKPGSLCVSGPTLGGLLPRSEPPWCLGIAWKSLQKGPCTKQYQACLCLPRSFQGRLPRGGNWKCLNVGEKRFGSKLGLAKWAGEAGVFLAQGKLGESSLQSTGKTERPEQFQFLGPDGLFTDEAEHSRPPLQLGAGVGGSREPSSACWEGRIQEVSQP